MMVRIRAIDVQKGSALANLPLLLDRLHHHLVQGHHQLLHLLSLTLCLNLAQELNGRGIKSYQLFPFIRIMLLVY